MTNSCYALKIEIGSLQASKAKEATEDLYSAFAGKTSLSQLSNTFVELARPKILFVESTLLMIVDTLLEQPPISWMVSFTFGDKLNLMHAIDLFQLYFSNAGQDCLPFN